MGVTRQRSLFPETGNEVVKRPMDSVNHVDAPIAFGLVGALPEYCDAMHETSEIRVRDKPDNPGQKDRISEYENKLVQQQRTPLFIAIFLLNFVVSVCLISLITYWCCL